MLLLEKGKAQILLDQNNSLFLFIFYLFLYDLRFFKYSCKILGFIFGFRFEFLFEESFWI